MSNVVPSARARRSRSRSATGCSAPRSGRRTWRSSARRPRASGRIPVAASGSNTPSRCGFRFPGSSPSSSIARSRRPGCCGCRRRRSSPFRHGTPRRRSATPPPAFACGRSARCACRRRRRRATREERVRAFSRARGGEACGRRASRAQACDFLCPEKQAAALRRRWGSVGRAGSGTRAIRSTIPLPYRGRFRVLRAAAECRACS